MIHGLIDLHNVSDNSGSEEILLSAMQQSELSELFTYAFQENVEKQLVITANPQVWLTISRGSEQILISSYEDNEVEATLNLNLQIEQHINIILVNPNNNTLTNKLRTYTNSKIQILTSQRGVFGSHFIEIRQDIQKTIPDRHLAKIDSCDNVCQIHAHTFKQKVIPVAINLLSYNQSNKEGLQVKVNGTLKSNKDTTEQPFLQIRVSKNAMSSAKHIATCPLPSHKMQQRTKLMRIRYDARHTETRTYWLHNLTEQDDYVIQEWLKELREIHATLDPIEECEETFCYIWRRNHDVQHMLHQISFCQEIDATVMNKMAEYQSLQLNSHQYVANLATGNFEKLTSELESLGHKTTHTQYAGTMSFGYVADKLHIALPPGGLAYLPATISIKQNFNTTPAQLLDLIVAEHKVIQHHHLPPEPGQTAHFCLAAKLPTNTDLTTIYGQHILRNLGTYTISSPTDKQSENWKPPFKETTQVSTIENWISDSAHFHESTAIATLAAYRKSDKLAFRAMSLMPQTHTNVQTLELITSLKNKTKSDTLFLRCNRNDWSNSHANKDPQITSLKELLDEQAPLHEDENHITEILLEGNFSLIWNPVRHLNKNLDIGGTVTLVNCQDALLRGLKIQYRDCPNLVIISKGKDQANHHQVHPKRKNTFQ